MRYVSAFLFATAAASHTAALANALGLAVLIGAGVLTLAFAVEAMIEDALTRLARTPPPPCSCSAVEPDELGRIFRLLDHPPE